MPIDREKLKEINKKYSISSDDPIALFANEVPDDYTYAPSGLLILDWAIGRPGLPKGRIVELYGPNQSGKTAISLVIAKSLQDQGEDVVYIDAEHALNPKWLGPLDRSKLLIVQPEVGEQALDIISDTIKAGAGLIIVDSVATLVPKAEAEASFEEKQRGELARMMSKAMRNLAPDVARSQSILIMINQVRSNMTLYGNPEISPGGQALPFSASLRIRVQKKEPIKDGNEVVGQKSKLSVIKNKIGAPGRDAEFDLMYYGDSPGIDILGSIFDAAEKCGLLIKRGAYVYRFTGEQFSHGKAAALTMMQGNPDIVKELQTAVWDTLK